MAELLMADNMGTILGSTALISAVGASNLGFTSTKYRSPLANKSCRMSRGFKPLQTAIPVCQEGGKKRKGKGREGKGREGKGRLDYTFRHQFIRRQLLCRDAQGSKGIKIV